MKKVILIILIITYLPINTFAYNDTAHSSIVVDLDSGRVLYKKNDNQKKLIASTTKIMTAIITIEKSNRIEKKVKIGKEVLKMYGTNIYVEVGEKMSIKDLLYGLMLRSGNDASVVLAKEIAGSEKEFVEMMNKKAQEIGMKNTIFRNPHGLDEKTQNYSTARDMAKLSIYAYKNKLYRKIISTKKYKTSTGKKTYLWYNKNKLLTNYKYCTGGKNGYTPKAGKTLVTTASKNNMNLTIVTLDDNDAYHNHNYLYRSMFNKYHKYKIISKNNFNINKQLYNEKVYIKESFFYPLSKNELSNIQTIVQIDKSIKSKNIGKITIYLSNRNIGSIKIYKQ
ncbi:MAG: D-alanyl-D-alanine carboxypeptidase [Bacilli bacterium]|nr:D-alanyl-D-alanine carboxypeptidase [Bacilli bacterium]